MAAFVRLRGAARLTSMGMHRGSHRSAGMALLIAVASSGLSGCTVYSTEAHPTLQMTTSAEQVQRIFWQSVAKADWIRANQLLAPNAVWRVSDHVIPREQIVPWLQSRGIRAVTVTDVALTPAVNDMNLVYTVQLQAERGVSAADAGASCGSQPQTLSALAVWQQPQPTGNPPAKNDKAYHGYLLTVQDLTPNANSACH